jgi:hypothetical protein
LLELPPSLIPVNVNECTVVGPHEIVADAVALE